MGLGEREGGRVGDAVRQGAVEEDHAAVAGEVEGGGQWRLVWAEASDLVGQGVADGGPRRGAVDMELELALRAGNQDDVFEGAGPGEDETGVAGTDDGAEAHENGLAVGWDGADVRRGPEGEERQHGKAETPEADPQGLGDGGVVVTEDHLLGDVSLKVGLAHLADRAAGEWGGSAGGAGIAVPSVRTLKGGASVSRTRRVLAPTMVCSVSRERSRR